MFCLRVVLRRLPNNVGKLLTTIGKLLCENSAIWGPTFQREPVSAGDNCVCSHCSAACCSAGGSWSRPVRPHQPLPRGLHQKTKMICLWHVQSYGFPTRFALHEAANIVCGQWPQNITTQNRVHSWSATSQKVPMLELLNNLKSNPHETAHNRAEAN